MRILCAAVAAAAFNVVPTIAVAAEFPAVVAEILHGQKTGRISEMGQEQKRAMIDCVNTVLAKLPNGKKRYVMQGANFEDREHRFGEVVQENHAEWKQKIARGCSSIALSRGASRAVPSNR